MYNGKKYTKQDAKNDAAKVKAVLEKSWKGWRIEVWENLGWHWRLWRGVVSVSPYYGKEYSCWVHRNPGESGIPGEWSDLMAHDKNPARAVCRSVDNLRTYLEAKVANLKAFADDLGTAMTPKRK